LYRFNNYIALILLLLFVRVLVPETTVLALHSHEHTEDQLNEDADFKLDKKHQHCQIDQLFNAPFTPALPVAITYFSLAFTDNYSVNRAYPWKFTFPNNTHLRGPPVA
jgi:hypothetical protein